MTSWWTPERCELHGQLWNEGLSARQIGMILGCSRNAVIGRAHRSEGLSVRVVAKRPGHHKSEQPAQQGQPTGYIRVRKPAPPKARQEHKPAPQFFGPPMSLLELEPRHCRWPLDGEDGQTWYCGAMRLREHSPYCEYHYKIAFHKARPPMSKIELARIMRANSAMVKLLAA